MQPLPSLQVAPTGLFTSAGQAADDPEQVSAASQGPAAARQTVELDANALAGHDAELPEQVSATSQAPAAARQTVELVANASAGQLVLAPVHCSATSQAPAEARHVSPAFPATCPQVPAVHESTVHSEVSGSQLTPSVRLVKPLHVRGVDDETLPPA